MEPSEQSIQPLDSQGGPSSCQAEKKTITTPLHTAPRSLPTDKPATTTDSTTVSSPPRIGRSVQDFTTEDDLQKSLSDWCLQNKSAGDNADWRITIPDHQTRNYQPQEVDTEVRRLWTLQSYLSLDSRREKAFEQLCQDARDYFQVPVSAISLVDLGRQFALASAGLTTDTSSSNNNNHILRHTTRKMAFCSHTILHKNKVMVVKDTKQDDRFQRNPLVTKAPHIRFYAGAPLVSPEGYHLGAFCIEGPEPRPQGLTAEQTEKLRDFARRTVDLMVQRRAQLLQRRNGDSPRSEQSHHDHLRWRRHAGVATNLGGLMHQAGEYVTAMKLFQESVQTLMLLEADCHGSPVNYANGAVKDEKSAIPSKQQDPPSPLPQPGPSKERQEKMSHLLNMLGAEVDAPDDRQAYINQAKGLMGTQSDDLAPTTRSKRTASTSVPELGSVPGLYGNDSNLKGTELHELGGLVFAEPFRITVNEAKDTCEHFIIPLDECSKATLFNMGLIHYHWGNADTAMQFFDLASSLSQQLSPLAFDPVILAAFNNMAQIHLQYRRPADAMELLKDALARGNAALAALYARDKTDWTAAPEEQQDSKAARRSRRLRRKLARTVLNLGHVHFVNSEYDAAMATCHDALRLLYTNTEDAEIAAVYHNIAIIHYHKGNKAESLVNLDKFLQRAEPIIGPDHLQIAEAMHDKGVTLFEMGQLYDSMKPLNEALRIRRLRLGHNHVSVAESLCLIGKVLVSREEYDFGLNAYLEGLAVYRDIAGSEPLSFDVAQNLLDIGRAFQVQGQLSLAIKTYEEVTELTQKFFGNSHPFVARLQNILGNLYLEHGKVDKSMEKFVEAVRILSLNNIPFNHNIVQDPLCRVHLSHNPVAPTA